MGLTWRAYPVLMPGSLENIIEMLNEFFVSSPTVSSYELANQHANQPYRATTKRTP